MEPEEVLNTASSKSNHANTRKMNRKEILETKKAINQIIKSATAVKDHLSLFPSFRYYSRNGLSLFLETDRGDKLTSHLKKCIQALLKENMEVPYGSEWPTEEKVKRKEMVSPDARYIFVHSGNTNEMLYRNAPIMGFVHYRFTIEEEIPVLYVYELQIERCIQGKGIGKFLMQLIELIAKKSCMGAVVLTVQKTNLLALNFYLTKLRYNLSSISPSVIGIEESYEILCRAFDHEAKAKLETSNTIF